MTISFTQFADTLRIIYCGFFRDVSQAIDMMASPTGLEPATFSLGNCCSIRLSYGDAGHDDTAACPPAPADRAAAAAVRGRR
jgi:hypothetical protein